MASNVTMMMIFILVLELLAFGDCRGANKLKDGDGISEIPTPDEKIFNVLNFGAKADGKRDNVEAFMQAWRAACQHPGKARLFIPKGEFLISAIIFAGPCKAISPIVFQLAGTLKASTDISMYPEPEWLLFQEINGLVFFGGGTVDGQGQLMWPHNDCKKNPDCVRLPSSIVLSKVENASIRRITSVNPMGFHYFISSCKKIRLQRLVIRAPDDSPNTDGIHISSSDDIRVSRSAIGTGDDCLGIIQGATRINVNKVVCGPGHGISIGSLGNREDEEDVVGVQVQNCTLKRTDNGVRIKTYQHKPNIKDPIMGTGFLFKDIVMDGVKNPIIINQEYCGSSSNCKGQPSKIKLSNIVFHNIIGTSTTPEAITLRCSSEVPCQNIQFNNVQLQGPNGHPSTAVCDNARVFKRGLINPPLNC